MLIKQRGDWSLSRAMEKVNTTGCCHLACRCECSLITQ